MISNPVRIGIIGASGWAEMMYLKPLARHSKATLAAICARSEHPAHELAQSYGIKERYTDWVRMIETAGLDAVAIVTPDDTHISIASAALENGLHVLCEKPLANTAADAWKLADFAKHTGLQTQVFFTWRWQPHFRFLKDLIDAKRVGTRSNSYRQTTPARPRDRLTK